MEMTTWEFTQNIFLALGGLGLFLLGLQTMSDGLKNIAGRRMRTFIEKATANRFLGFLFGMIVTAVTQSSTATSVMGIGFVDAGLMESKQFASIVIGAGIGTTFTAFLFNFRIDPIAPLIIFTGIALYMFVNKKKVKDIGFITLGIGLIFFALSTMGTPLREISQLDGFQSMLSTFGNPALAFLAGLLFTAVIQSSTATVGIIIVMYVNGVDMDFSTTAFLILGANVGTCSTALLSSLAGSRDSKRAALILTAYKFIAGGVSSLLILIFPGILTWTQETWQNGAIQIAMFHTMYNVFASGVMIFFTKQLVSIAYFIIPKRAKDETERKLMYLEESKEPTLEVIFSQAHGEMNRMGKLAMDNLKLSLEAFFARDVDKANKVMEYEKTIDYLKHEISSYLMSVESVELTQEYIEKFGSMLHILNDMERLGDHAENIAEHTIGEKDYSKYLSETAVAELTEISDTMMGTLALSLEIFKTQDNTRLPEAEKLEQKVDDLCDEYLARHIKRLRSGCCDPRCSVIYTSMVRDLERCSDHAINIAERIFGEITQPDHVT